MTTVTFLAASEKWYFTTGQFTQTDDTTYLKTQNYYYCCIYCYWILLLIASNIIVFVCTTSQSKWKWLPGNLSSSQTGQFLAGNMNMLDQKGYAKQKQEAHGPYIANLRNGTFSKTAFRFCKCRSKVTVKVIWSKMLVPTKWPCQKEQICKIWQPYLTNCNSYEQY